MLGIIDRALFASAVVVAQNIVRFEVIGVRQPFQQADEGVVGFLGELSVVRLVAAFDRNRILVAGLDRIGNLIQGHALDDLSVVADDKVGAGAALVVVLELFKIAAVLGGAGAGIRRIVDENILHLGQRIPGAGVVADCQKILCPFGVCCVGRRRQPLDRRLRRLGYRRCADCRDFCGYAGFHAARRRMKHPP